MLGAKGFEVNFVPESADIIWSSKLVDPGKEQVIEFTAPTAPGTYTYYAQMTDEVGIATAFGSKALKLVLTVT